LKYFPSGTKSIDWLKLCPPTDSNERRITVESLRAVRNEYPDLMKAFEHEDPSYIGLSEDEIKKKESENE